MMGKIVILFLWIFTDLNIIRCEPYRIAKWKKPQTSRDLSTTSSSNVTIQSVRTVIECGMRSLQFSEGASYLYDRSSRTCLVLLDSCSATGVPAEVTPYDLFQRLDGCQIQSVGVRLVNGNNQYSGRVEVFYNNSWGTVCDDGFTDFNAAVACSMLGFSNTQMAFYRPNAAFGSGQGPIHMDDVICSGSESSLWDCSYIRDHDCDHIEDVGVICLQTATIRLVDGPTYYEGRLELLSDIGTWGTVCNTSFTDINAAVACSMLGFCASNSSRSNHITYDPALKYGNTSSPIIMNDVSCQGFETSLWNCSHSATLNCTHSQDVALHCGRKNTVRLVGGQSHLEGRVEVYYNDTWGTVCDDYFTNDNAAVVCTMLSLCHVVDVASLPNAPYGEGTGPIFLDDVTCTGSEESLWNCSYTMDHDCDHTEDVGVKCFV